MKKLLVLALAAASAGGIAYGQGTFSASVDLTYASEYIFRGVKLSDQTLHPSIEFKQDEFYLGFWGALPINDRSSQGYIDEYDFYAGFGPKLSDNVSLDIGATYYYYTAADETIEGYVGITGDMGGLTPGFYVYRDFDLDVYTFQASAGYSIPLGTAASSLDLSVAVGSVKWDDSGAEDYLYYGIDASIPYKINENATITLGAHWASNDLPDSFGIDDSNLWWTLGMTVGF